MDEMDRSEHYVRIRKTDEERRIVYGVVYEPFTLDTYGEMMVPAGIEEMAHRYMQLPDVRRTIDTNHDEVSNGSYPIESFIARKGDPDYPEGSWVLGVKVPEDRVWDAIKKGELNGFSFQAMVRKLPAVVDVEIVVDNLGITSQADDGHDHIFYVEIDDDGKVKAGRTSTDDGHSHEIVSGTRTEAASGHSHRLII